MNTQGALRNPLLARDQALPARNKSGKYDRQSQSEQENSDADGPPIGQPSAQARGHSQVGRVDRNRKSHELARHQSQGENQPGRQSEG